MTQNQNLQNLKKQVSEIKWRHKIDLGNGITTPGNEQTSERCKKIKLDDDLKGKTVLDLGAWDGFYSFECERRGASRVLALDSYIWMGKDKYWASGKRGFELARKILHSKVEDVEMEILDISPEIGEFDLVLFLGVLYHMRHPLLSLEKVSSVTKDMLILETEIDTIGGKRPAMMFYPENELNNDPTNWWVPNPQAVKDMLKDVGFKKVKMVSRTPFARRIGGAILKNRSNISLLEKMRQGRAVFHAWK